MTTANHLNVPSPDLLNSLSRIVGDSNALRSGDTSQARYLTEWRDRYTGKTPLVVRPSSTSEVSAILGACNAARVGIVPQSGNTGLVGGQIPHETDSEVVLSLDRMRAIRAIDPDGQCLTADAGVPLTVVQQTAREVGLMFPLSMASEGSACIGGVLATNAGGISVLAHGTARALVFGLEVVLADGRILKDLNSLKKDNTGYDLKDLFIGSEGTLGIITAATLKLLPPPTDVATAFLAVAATSALVPLFKHASRYAGPSLTAFEFMSQGAMEFVLRHGRATAPVSDITAPYTVLLEVSTAEPGRATPLLEALLCGVAEEDLIIDVGLASSASQQAALWKLREQMSEVQKHEGGSIKHDISLPVARIPEFLERAAAIVERISPGARPVPFGHLGDGNVHYNVSQPVGAEKAAYLALWETMSAAIHDLVDAMNGSISAEHGIGRMKRDELQRLKGPVALGLMRSIKTAFDANGILNPGKVL